HLLSIQIRRKKTMTQAITMKKDKNLHRLLTEMVRVGRIANSLAFAEPAYLHASRLPKHLRQQQLHHAALLLGGYLYEGIQLIDELMPEYGTAPAFSRRMDFAAKSRPHREV